MADQNPKEEPNIFVNLTENIFTATLVYTMEFAIIYIITTLLMFSGLYTYCWAIKVVGILAIFHLIALPIAYFGVKYDIRLLVLLSILLCSIWFILIIVYVVVFSVQTFPGNDFNYRSLHHIFLVIYAILDVVVVILLSIDIISEKSRNSIRKSLNESPTAPEPPQPPQPLEKITPRPSVKTDEKLKKK